MSRFSLFILVLITLMCGAHCLHPEKCQAPPKEKHCIIEYRVRYRWPHQIRYVYNWYTKSCFQINWSNNCPPPVVPTVSNNFPTEQECLQECGGWA